MLFRLITFLGFVNRQECISSYVTKRYLVSASYVTKRYLAKKQYSLAYR